MQDQPPDPSREPYEMGDEVALGSMRSTPLEMTDDVFRTRVKAGPNAGGGPLHRHMHQTERLMVEQGTLRVRTGLRGSRLIGPGEDVVIPPGKPHTFTVESSSACYIDEFTPRLKLPEYFEELFALDNPSLGDMARLAQKYPKEHFYLPMVPPVIQRAVLRPFA